jgi:hypothetical protein
MYGRDVSTRPLPQGEQAAAGIRTEHEARLRAKAAAWQRQNLAPRHPMVTLAVTIAYAPCHFVVKDRSRWILMNALPPII